MRIALEAVLLKLHANLSPGWVLIPVNLDPKVQGGHSFVSGPIFARLNYIVVTMHMGTFRIEVSILQGSLLLSYTRAFPDC